MEISGYFFSHGFFGDHHSSLLRFCVAFIHRKFLMHLDQLIELIIDFLPKSKRVF